MSRDPFHSNQFLTEEGTLPPPRIDEMIHNWLPERKQAINALQLQFEPYTEGISEEIEEIEGYPPYSVWYTSMRQGLGLIVVAGLVAGFLPFLVNWFVAARVGAVVPLAELVRSAQQVQIDTGMTWGTFQGSGLQALQTAAGLSPAVFPGWLAAGLSALGLWINWPLNWLGLWLIYGAAVALVAHWLGSPVTMQRFYALTSYAALPLILTGLGIIPCIGFLINLFAAVYASIVYIFAVRASTGLSPGRAIIATLAPGAILLALGLILTAAFGAALIATLSSLILGM